MILRRQHGVITCSQAAGAGLSRYAVAELLRRGIWERLTRGIYRVAGSPGTFAQRAMAACLAGGPLAVGSHCTALHLLGLNGNRRPPETVEVTVPATHSTRSAPALGVVLHRTRHFDRRDLVRVDGIPLTKPARVLVDRASVLPQAEVDDLVDEVLCRYPTVKPAMILSALARARPRRGQPQLRAALQPWMTGTAPESVPEMSLLRRLTEAGLPQPQRQYQINDPRTGSFVARCDLAYPEARLAIEYDGGLTHGPRSRAHDERRRNEIIESGWHVVTARRPDADRASCRPFVDSVRAELRWRQE